MDQVKTNCWQALVIEDEIPLAGIFSKALQFAGFNTGELYDGREALAWLQGTDEVPLLVLIDFHLPLVSGGEILHFIRENERFENTRVIMTTSDPAALSEDVEQQSDLVLLKPISYTQLRDLASRFR